MRQNKNDNKFKLFIVVLVIVLGITFSFQAYQNESNKPDHNEYISLGGAVDFCKENKRHELCN